MRLPATDVYKRQVVLYDGNEKLSAEELKKNFDEGAKVSVILGELKKLDLSGVELCVISPGISLEAVSYTHLGKAGERSSQESPSFPADRSWKKIQDQKAQSSVFLNGADHKE